MRSPSSFRWNDPYDTSVPVLNQPPTFSGSGTSTGGSAVDFGPFSFTAGTEYVITEVADPQLPTDNFDGIVAVIDQNGNTIVDQDAGIDETVIFPANDWRYHPRHPYAAQPPVYTQGTFDLTINTANGIARIT